MEPLLITVPGEMRGKGRPRFSRRGRFVHTHPDQKTESAETWVKSCAVDQVGNPCVTMPICVWLTIGVPIRASWPKKKQAAAHAGTLRPGGKPDLDNIVKLVCDALNKIVWLDDAQIVDLVASKKYAAQPFTLIRVEAA
jgi:Holliday junction resolvase RusA-like endonuclease